MEEKQHLVGDLHFDKIVVVWGFFPVPPFFEGHAWGVAGTAGGSLFFGGVVGRIRGAK